MFKNRKHSKETFTYDSQTHYPIIRSSICTGEKVAGFKSKIDGSFSEIMLIRNSSDLETFKKTYGIEEIKTEY